MSLIKARLFDNKDFSYNDLEIAFQDTLEVDLSEEDFYNLVDIYSTYSCLYLREVAFTLKEPKGIKSTMTYMNSYIAEFAHQLSIPYFHKEEGYSIIDKAVQYVLNNGVQTKMDYVKDIVEALRESTIEKVLEE